MQTTIPKGNMGYDQCTVRETIAVEPTFVAFFYHSQTYGPWPLVSFFQTSLKNSEFKTVHNTFRGLSRAVFPTTFLEIAASEMLRLNPALKKDK